MVDSFSSEHIGSYEEVFLNVENLMMNISTSKDGNSRAFNKNLLSEELVLSPMSDYGGIRDDNSQFSDNVNFDGSVEKDNVDYSDDEVIQLDPAEIFLKKLKKNNNLQKKPLGLGIYQNPLKHMDGSDLKGLKISKCNFVPKRVISEKVFFYLSLVDFSQTLKQELAEQGARLYINMECNGVVLRTVEKTIASVNTSLLFQNILSFPKDWITDRAQVHITLKVEIPNISINKNVRNTEVNNSSFGKRLLKKSTYFNKKTASKKSENINSLESLKNGHILASADVDLRTLMDQTDELKRVSLMRTLSKFNGEKIKNLSTNRALKLYKIATLILHSNV